jgi:hypothetical protein
MNTVFLIMSISLLQGSPKIVISEPSFDFGHSLVAQNYRHKFWIYNKGDATLTIKGVRTFCGCSTTQLSKSEIEPGDSASFEFIYDTQGFFSEVVKWAYVRSNDPVDTLTKFNVTARLYEDYTRTPFEINPTSLIFGRMNSLKEEIELKIKNRSRTSYRIRLLEASPALEDVSFSAREFKPGEEIVIPLRPRKGITDASLFKSSLTFEATTPTEIVRFSVPLIAIPVR